MSKKRNKKTANKSLETLKRKQFARGGRRGNPPAKKAAQPVQELKQIKSAPIPLKVSDQKPTKIGGKPTPLPKPIGNKGIDPKSLFSDPNMGGEGPPKPRPKVPVTAPKPRPSLFADPVKVGGIKNPKDIKLPEPSRSTGGGREALLGNQTPISNEIIAPPPSNLQYNISEADFDKQNRGSGPIQQSQNVAQQSIMGSGFTGLTPAQLAKLAEDYGGGYNPKAEGTQENNGNGGNRGGGGNQGGGGQDDQAPASDTMGGVTVEGKTSTGGPRGITYDAPETDLRQMEAELISREGTETGAEDIQKLEDATDATSSTVTADTLTAEQGRAKQATVSGVDSEADQYADKYIEQYPEWNTVQKNQAREWAYSQRSGGTKKPMPSWLMDSDFLKGLEVANKMTFNTTERDATTYKATTTEGEMDATVAAQMKGDPTKAVAGQVGATTQAPETQRDAAAEEAAKGTFADRPEYQAYATAAKDDTDYGFDPKTVSGPKVTISKGVTIPQSKVNEIRLDAEKRGLNPTEALKAYSDAMVERKVKTGIAAEGTEASISSSRGTTAQADFLEAANVAAGRKEQIDKVPTFEKETSRLAQTGKAAQGTEASAGSAYKETAADADFLGAGNVAAGRKEQIANAGTAGFAGREGRQADSIGDMDSATVNRVSAAEQGDRKVFTDDVSAQAEAEQTSKLQQFNLDRERKAVTGTFAERDAATLKDAPTDTSASARFLESANVVAGRKEQIADTGTVGFAGREGQQAKTLGGVSASQMAPVTTKGIADRTAETNQLTTEAGQIGTDLTSIPEFLKTGTREAQTGKAAVSKYSNRLGVPPEKQAAQAQYFNADFTPQGGNTEIESVPAYEVAATRTAQVAEATTRIASELGNAPSIDLEGREAVTGTAPQGDAAQIGGVPTMAAATMQAVTGQDRTVAAADMMAVVANVQPEITAAIAQDPATVEAQLDSGADPQTVAAVAALPIEALVSTQMEGLLAGMEDGETPAWARPAVAAMEARMAQRGLATSTVGRDALFNAIIQSALPIAQSNAQALQQRAQQNLSNEQQANLSTAQNTMQVRMQNLSNRQTAASQTAEMAQQIKVQQGSFDQQAVMTSAQQRQETGMANAQMAQQRAQQTSAQSQQAAIAELSTNAQMDLANLQALNAAGTQNLNAEQQARLQTYSSQINKTMRQADLNQDMEKANLSPALQVEMQRVSEMNAASKDTMTADQTERLTNLQTLIDFRKTDAQFAQQMDMANMSNEQQIELANLQEKASTDSANFTSENQFKLQELNNIVARSARQSELNQQMETVNLDSKLKIELSELSEKNNTSRANMSSEQQTRLKNLETLVNFKTTNAQLAQQMDMANMSNEQQINMAELADKSATDSANFTETNRFELQRLQTYAQFMSENTNLLQQTELANFTATEKLNLANLSALNQASSENLTKNQQLVLANLDSKLKQGTLNAQLRQQVITQTFSQSQQTELANLEARNKADSESLSNEQQAKLTTYNAKVQSTIRQSELNSRMEEVNLDSRLKVELSELTEKNATSRANMSSDQQMRLKNIDTLLAFKTTNAQLAQQMDLANMGNEQQIEMAMLADKAATDSANFTEANRFKLTQLQTAAQHMAQNTGFRQQTELANMSSEERLQLANLTAQNQASSENLSSAQQVELANLNAKLTTGVKNAELRQQAISQTFSADQQTELANLESLNRADSESLTNEQQSKLTTYNAKVQRSIRQTELNSRMEEVNLDARLKVELSELSEKNATSRANMSAENSVRLANLSSFVDLKKTNAGFVQQMELANMSNEQQVELASLQDRAATDSANFTADNQFKLTELNSIVTRSIRQTELNSRMEEVNLDARA